MSKGIYLDIETIPCQQEGYLRSLELEAKLNFKAPSDLTKGQACAELGMTDAKEIKFTSKEKAIELWEEKFAVEKAPQVADKKYRDTSFDGALGEVISISWAVDDGEIQAVSRLDYEDENAMLASFFLRLAKESSLDYFIGHNIRFDLEFLWKRAVVNGLNPGVKLKWQGRHGTSFFCTQEAWGGFKNYISQDNLCEILGLEQKPDGIDGSKVYDYYLEGKMQEIVDYNKYDVGTVREIYKRVSV